MAVMTRKGGGRRGRPPKTDKTQPWTVRLPESITGPWDLILHDATIGRSKIGLRQFIISELMRLLLAAWQRGETTIDVGHIINRVGRELHALDSKTLPEEDND